MFASPFASPRNLAASYRRVEVDTAVAVSDPHALVTMLYDGALAQIVRARAAIKAGDPGAKGEAIGRAIRIVDEGLKASLDMRGGELAANLRALYEYMTHRLLQANLKGDEEMLLEVSGLIGTLRGAWVAIAPGAPARGASAAMAA